MVIGSRKEREFERRESEILAAALDLFARDDWELVTVDEIAKKVMIEQGVDIEYKVEVHNRYFRKCFPQVPLHWNYCYCLPVSGWHRYYK